MNLLVTRLNTSALLLGLLLLAKPGRAQQVEVDPQLIHAQWNSLLFKYVSPAGRSITKGLLPTAPSWNPTCNLFARPPRTHRRAGRTEDKIAFWVNVYNAATVQVIAQYYPIASMKDIRIKSFWVRRNRRGRKSGERGRRRLLAERTSKTRFCASATTTRAFTLCWCARRCRAPTCWAKPTTALTLKKQLEAQATRFINDPPRTSCDRIKWRCPTYLTGTQRILASRPDGYRPTSTATPRLQWKPGTSPIFFPTTGT